MKYSKYKSLATILMFSSILAISLNSCMKDEVEAAKSMEQLHKENGIPVRVENVELKSFDSYLAFYSQLNGMQEVNVGAPVGDKVESVKASIGQYVKEKQVIITYPKDNPQFQIQQAEKALELSEKTYKRMKNLLEAGEIAQQQFDQVETQYLVDKRNLEQLNDVLEVDSPISGTIVEMYAQEGYNYKKETVLFKVAKLDKMKATIWVNDSEIAYINKGGNALLKYQGEEFSGTISDVAMALDPKRKAFRAEVEFPNPKRKIRSGITSDILVKTYSNDSTIVVPRNLVFGGSNSPYVYVNENGVAKKRNVKIGQEKDIQVEIIEGLKVSDQLITDGATKVKDGTKINIVE